MVARLGASSTRFPESGDRFVHAAQFLERIAHVAPGPGKIRLELHRARINRDSLGIFFLIVVHIAKAVVALDMVGLELNDVGKAGDCFVQFSLVVQCTGQIELSFRRARAQSSGLRRGGDGFVVPLLLAQRRPQIAVGIR